MSMNSMKITVCGSMSFAREMLNTKAELENLGHICYLPEGVDEYVSGQVQSKGGSEGARRKAEHNLIKNHYELIKQAEAILVLNHDKKEIKGYIGGNSFLEIGFAHILGRKIFLLKDIPEISFFKEELLAIQPIILDGDVKKIYA